MRAPLYAPRRRLAGRSLRSALGLTALLALLAPGPLVPATAQAQEAGAETGIVRISSPVLPAQVYVDNELVGEAPVARYLPEGPHTIRITADNYAPFVRRVDVVAGRTLEVAAQMLPGEGSVEFVAQPGGARLSINNSDAVPTPIRLTDLKPGEYRYLLSAPGHEPEEGTFTFIKGKNLLFSVRLKSTAGLVTVRSTPDGARVWLDGRSVGETPLTLEGVDAGAHVVRLERQGYATVFRRFDNADGSKGEVTVSLPDDGASLVVNTGLPTGVLRVEGHEIGQGELIRVPSLERGRYQVEVSAPGRDPAVSTIELPPGGRLLLRAELAVPGDRDPSALERVKPLTGRWTFWTGTALGAGAAAAGGWLLAGALTPEHTPESETVVVLP